MAGDYRPQPCGYHGLGTCLVDHAPQAYRFQDGPPPAEAEFLDFIRRNKPVFHFCLLSPCNCDGRRNQNPSATVPPLNEYSWVA